MQQIPAYKLIPHRDSMLLIDSFTPMEPGQGRAETTLTESSIAATASGEIDSLILVELIAQAYAALKGWEFTQAGMDIPIGYLVGVQKFTVLGAPQTDQLLTIEVATLGEFDGFAIIEGTVSNGDTTLASGKIKLWAPDGASEDET